MRVWEGLVMQQYEVNLNNALKLLRTKIMSIEDIELRNQISDKMESNIEKTLKSINETNLQSNPNIMKMIYDMTLAGVNKMIANIDDLLLEQNKTRRF